MNNPRRIQFTNGNVREYVYSADGEKLRTIHRTAVNNITVPIGNTLPLTVANTLSVNSTDYIGPFFFGNNCAVVNENDALEQVTHYFGMRVHILKNRTSKTK